MGNIILEKDQRTAVDEITKWYNDANQVRFTFAGYAGTGKTTLVRVIIEELGLKMDEVAFCAFTGKAAMVLTMKGTPATTMHKLMYDCKEDEFTKELVFVRKEELDKYIKLIVVDEASMVSKELQADLESYGVPILYVGDHGQLPPVGDAMSNLMLNPDVALEKIHRQAEGNPIIWLAKMARLGAKIPNKVFGESCIKMSVKDVTPAMLLNADQILCGKNDTRRKLNLRLRALKGYNTPEPVVGDRAICLRNNWNKGFVNGMTGEIRRIEPFDMDQYRGKRSWMVQGSPAMTFAAETGDMFYNVPFDKEIFTANKAPDMREREIECFDYAYAITVHKAQGSQYLFPIVFEEYLGNADFHKKWLYTAITRAANGLVLAGR